MQYPKSKYPPCNKIDKPLAVYRFTGNVMTSITSQRWVHNDKIKTFFLQQKWYVKVILMSYDK